jgi:uncharacterized protein (DUF1684 family)
MCCIPPSRFLLAVPLASLVLAGACSPPGPQPAPEPTKVVDTGYRAEIEAWRGERLASLTSDDGWLTLIGLVWLVPGANTVGSAPGSAVLLPADAAPAEAAVLTLGEDGTVTLKAAPGVALTVAGTPLGDGERVLASDAALASAPVSDMAPDVVGLGRLRFHIIARGGRLAVRVKDPDAATRRDFAGIDYFPIDPELRVTARFEPYPTPRQVSVPSVVGTAETMTAPGLLRFTIGGSEHTLEPFAPADGELQLVFRDATAGSETYGAGRSLALDAPGGGTVTRDVILDFNRAFNPPCAFTPYATCPLPTASNILAIPIRAGERYAN